jgi:hypothetical protein
MKTTLSLISATLFGLAALAFVPDAAAACLTGSTNCVNVPAPPYCAAEYYAGAGSDHFFVACVYATDSTPPACAAAIYGNGNNQGIVCVEAFRGSCTLMVAVITNDDAGTGWVPVVC